ncbi:MDR/SDR family oxidoreductase, partial [Streptomonospora algeriensis]
MLDRSSGGVVLTPRERRRPGPGRVEIAVEYAALTFRDALQVLGMNRLAGESDVLGLECAGTVVRTGRGVHTLEPGQRVVALSPRSMGAYLEAPAELVRPYPEHLGAAEASTVPVSFATAYRALCELAQVRPGESVVVHNATGGTGLAAMQVARWRGARVLATAGSEEKRDLLRFLGASAVADSRSLDFVEEFRRATGGRGADVVLNTLAGEALQAGLSLLAPYGRHIELGKKDIGEGRGIALGDFSRELSFHAVDIWRMAEEDPARAGELLEKVLALLGGGLLGPLPHEVFGVERAQDAFDLMTKSRHRGKLVLDMGRAAGAGTGAAPSGPGLTVRPDATYLITGGAGDLGVALAQRLVDKGARHLLLLGRTRPSADGPTARVLEGFRERGCHVEFAEADCADEAALRSVLQGRAAAGRPAVRGCAHAAGVLEPAPLTELDAADFAAATRAKVRGGLALHHALDGADLDFFVLFSSASAVVDSPLMASYAAANAFLDGLAHERRARSLPATTVNWGFWEGLGMAHRIAEQQGRSIMPEGVRGFQPGEGLDLLERLVAEDATQAVVMPTDWARWARAYPAAAARPIFDAVVRSEPGAQAA